MRRFGLRFQDNDLAASAVDEGYNVSLQVDGATVPTVELEDQLRALRGVTQVRDVRRLLPPHTGVGARLAQALETDETIAPTVHDVELPSGINVSSVTSDDELQRRRESADRIETVLASYPAIGASVLAYTQSVRDAADSAALVRNFGLRCGRRIAATESRFVDAEGLSQALEKVIVGFLFPIARAQVDGQTLRVAHSIFTPEIGADESGVSDLASRTPYPGERSCAFLEGLIEGMLNHAPALPTIRVEESRCRSRGDAECHFHIDVVSP